MPLNRPVEANNGLFSPSLLMPTQHQQQPTDIHNRILIDNSNILRKISESPSLSITGTPFSSKHDTTENSTQQNASSVNTIPNIQSKIIALSNKWDSKKDTPKISPSNNAHTEDTKILTSISSYPVPQLSHKSLKAVKNLTDRYAPKGVNTKKSLRKTSKKFLIKFVEMERKKRQLNSEDSQQIYSKQTLSDMEKKSKENTLLVKATKDLEEKIESVSQNLTFLEKQSQRDKQLIQFYRNRERSSTNAKVQNPLLATASNFIIGGAPRQSLNNMQQAVVTLFESQGLPSDPFDLSTMTPPKGTSLKSIVYYWKVFCKISYVCRFILTKEYNSNLENSVP